MYPGDQLLRRVRITSADGSRYTLTMWATTHTDDRGQTQIAYRFGRLKAAPIFEGRDFFGSPLHADDSDATVTCLLCFLTLRPGDMGREYFTKYSAEQLAWAKQHAEALAIAVEGRFGAS